MRFRSRHFLLGALLVAFLVVALALPAEAARKKRRQAARPAPDRFASIVIEASTGYVLQAKNPDKRLYPASLTKMMTLYMAFEALDKGTISKNTRISVSRHASSQEPSSLGLRPGDTIRVEDAILGIATKSANDAAVALGEALGGTEGRFARMMSTKARALGMNNTNFANASGLSHKDQYSSARDMSILSQALIRNFPRHYRYFSTSTFTYKDNTYINHNKLMATYQGMDGLKTGYVYASGYNLAASATRNGTRLIGVIFGGQTAKSRNSAMAKLLDQSFARISDVRVSSLAANGQQNVSIPARRPAVIESITEVTADNPSTTTAVVSALPLAGSAGLAIEEAETEQGDAAVAGDEVIKKEVKQARITRGKPPKAPEPRQLAELAPSSQQVAATGGKGGEWTIQIGAYETRDASLRALQSARSSLQHMMSGVEAISAPLKTKKGMVYRARLSGLDRTDAKEACRILRGGCLVLTVE